MANKTVDSDLQVKGKVAAGGGESKIENREVVSKMETASFSFALPFISSTHSLYLP